MEGNHVQRRKIRRKPPPCKGGYLPHPVGWRSSAQFYENGICYMNCGDWVESCTVLAEHEDGRFEIITWTELVGAAPVASVAARAA